MIDPTKLYGYLYSWYTKIAYVAVKKVWPSKVESYLKDECMV